MVCLSERSCVTVRRSRGVSPVGPRAACSGGSAHSVGARVRCLCVMLCVPGGSCLSCVAWLLIEGWFGWVLVGFDYIHGPSPVPPIYLPHG